MISASTDPSAIAARSRVDLGCISAIISAIISADSPVVVRARGARRVLARLGVAGEVAVDVGAPVVVVVLLLWRETTRLMKSISSPLRSRCCYCCCAEIMALLLWRRRVVSFPR